MNYLRSRDKFNFMKIEIKKDILKKVNLRRKWSGARGGGIREIIYDRNEQKIDSTTWCAYKKTLHMLFDPIRWVKVYNTIHITIGTIRNNNVCPLLFIYI